MLSADEGQWLPEQIRDLDWVDLQGRGLELTPEELWNGSEGLLSAAVNINGCSASFVSAEGLIITNHHCGYRAINDNSTVERNYLEAGFVAGSREEELRANGYRVSIVRGSEDVTPQIREVAEAAGDDPAARWRAVQERRRALVEEGEKLPNTSVIVVPYFDGREWRRIYRTELRDVRLVYAPPSMVGEYGGEVDNWMWPRHTGDFAFFRAYVAPDGSPADYAEENVPYQPPRWLEVSPEGIGEGDLVMIMGYPGRTSRYLTSVAVAGRESYFYPMRRKVYGAVIDALRAATEGNPEAELRVASTLKSFSNVLKNADGMIWGLARNRVVERKLREEEEFRAWVDEAPRREALYGEVLDRLLALDRAELERQEHDFILDQLARRSTLLRAAMGLADYARDHDPEAADEGARERLERRLHGQVQGALLAADQEILELLIRESVALDRRIGPSPVDGLKEHFGADLPVAQLAARAVAETHVADPLYRAAFFDAVEAGEALPADPLVDFAWRVSPLLQEQRDFRDAQSGARMEVGALWIQAQEEWRGRSFYPDANRTLRLSIATVKGYEPRDGVLHTPFTTVDGMVRKHSGEHPFDVPDPVLEASGESGAGRVPVCFLADGDTTGGNSGSPVMDGKGRLVGLNFDRVFENVSGDFGWNPERSRNISVDIRFVLWMLDRVYPAPNLLDEMRASGPILVPGR